MSHKHREREGSRNCDQRPGWLNNVIRDKLSGSSKNIILIVTPAKKGLSHDMQKSRTINSGAVAHKILV